MKHYRRECVLPIPLDANVGTVCIIGMGCKTHHQRQVEMRNLTYGL